MIHHYNYLVVAFSFIVAWFAAYRAIRLAENPGHLDQYETKVRILLGGLTLGTGIWGMHFVGMLALHLPIPLHYDTPLTLFSGLFAIMAACFAFWQVSHLPDRRLPMLGIALAMGAGISIMHYTGMAALRMQPAIHYDPGLFVLSVLIAIGASFAAVKVMLFMPTYRDRKLSRWLRLGSSILLAIGISGMHYTGMAAAEFHPDSVCLADPNSLTPGWLLVQVVAMVSLPLLLEHFLAPTLNLPRSVGARVSSALPVVVLLTLSGLAFFTWKEAKESVQYRSRFEFDHLVQDKSRQFLQLITRQGELLLGVAALYAASRDVDPDEFRVYGSRSLLGMHYPGVQTMGVLRPLHGLHSQPLLDCFGANSGIRTEDLAPLVQTIPAAGPMPRLAWTPTLRQNLSLSLLTEQPTLFRLSAPPLARADTAIDALMVYPIFHNGKPHHTPALRCSNLFGWVYAGINSQTMLASLQHPTARIGLYEGDKSLRDTMVWESKSPANLAGYQAEYSGVERIHAGNHSWTLTVKQAQRQNDTLYDGLTIISMLGMGSALFVTTLVFLLNQARTRAFNSAEALARELSEKARLIDFISEQNLDLERAAQIKTQFLSTMSHELRTPLNSILGFSEILAEANKGPLNDAQREILRHIQDSGKHLLSLVNDTLDLARIEAGRMPINEEAEDVYGLLSDCVANLQGQAKKQRIHLVMEAGADLGLIWTDGRKVRQILLNLLSNAIKFSHQGGRVTLGARPVGSMQTGLPSGDRPGRCFTFERGVTETFLEMRIEDAGIGIAEPDLAKLFQPFFQIDSRLSRRFGGTGLGLALTKSLVEHLGGAICIQSRAGQGTCFTVWIPWRTKVPEGMSTDHETRQVV